ncbi:MAG TPA: exodeoxyribonuclease VII large subunit [Prosthecobacter sp.]|nr:exodeoxyribonuclease VII large subunit [Prosthecobacter sp.]
METDPAREILTVSQLTREIREVLEGRVGSVWVEGEISNHRLQTSGHQYFTLKDEGSQVSCVLFRGAARMASRLRDGDQVQVFGGVSVYEPRGQYQLVVRQVRMKGQGGLQARFEALKKKLFAEGLFDEAVKRPIPRVPQTVALVTSPTGAAIQDMLNILTRRAPWVRVLVFPVRVQGQGVEQETIRALEILNNAESRGLPRPDTIVIGRGGGSLEDLWAYNEEALARAIRASEIPVISAVGHEIDFTIADFAADLRAPTPSAAAELLAPEAAGLLRHFETRERGMENRVENLLEHHDRVLDLTARGALARGPEWQLLQSVQQADEAESRLNAGARAQIQELADQTARCQHTLARRHPEILLSEAGHKVETAGRGMNHLAARLLERIQQRLDSRRDLLRQLGPHAVLARGFSYTTDSSGRVLKNAADAGDGELIRTLLAEGCIESVVRKK